MPPATGLHRDHHAAPFLAAILGIALFSVMDGLMKGASLAVGAYSAMLIRSVFGVAIMLPLWKLSGGRWPDRDALKLHALRGAISAGMATTFFWGLVRMPMAEAIALSFIAPLIALYLAAVMLGEQIERRAILGSALGFGGVLVIGAVRLDAGGFSDDAVWGIAAILVSAVLYAFNLIYQRKQAQLAGPREVALFQMGFSALFLALFAVVSAALLTVLHPVLLYFPVIPMAVAYPVLPDAATTVQIAASAVLAAVSLMLLSWGYGRAEAQALLPIEYTAFIWAALLGWWMFDEAVTWPTIAGAVLIVAGCLIAARKPTEQTAL